MSDSAFSGVGLLTQFSYLLLIFAMFPARLFWVRVVVMMSAAVAVIAGLIEYRDPVAVFWQLLLFVVNAVLLAQFAYRNARVRFNAEEQPMVAGMLAGLPAVRARHFLDQGFWLNGQAGEVLIREGDPVSHLFYLAAGEARVMSAGKPVGHCRTGDLIGEVTVLSGDQASATVVLDSAARMWCAPARTLKLYLDAHHDVRHAVEMSFAAALRHKLRATNRAVVAAGGVRE